MRHHHGRSSKFGGAIHIGVIRQFLRTRAVQGGEGLRVGQFDLLPAARHNRLQIFGSHHQSHAGATVIAVGHAQHGGEQYTSLGGRAMLKNFDFVITEFPAENLIHFPRDPAHQMRSIVKLIFTINDRQVDRFGRFAFDDNAIETCEFQFGGEIATALRIADAAADGRFGIDVDAALPGDGRAGGHAAQSGYYRGQARRRLWAFLSGYSKAPSPTHPYICDKKIRAALPPSACLGPNPRAEFFRCNRRAWQTPWEIEFLYYTNAGGKRQTRFSESDRTTPDLVTILPNLAVWFSQESLTHLKFRDALA